MGVRDVITVHGWNRGEGLTACRIDGEGEGREYYARLVHGCDGTEYDTSSKPGYDWVCISDSARVALGACDLHWGDSSRSDRMRGNRVEVRDLGEVSAGSRIAGNSSSSCDDRRARWQHDPSIVV